MPKTWPLAALTAAMTLTLTLTLPIGSGSGVAAAATSRQSPPSALRQVDPTVTLITGDRVMLHESGGRQGAVIRPAKGRERVPFVTGRSGGHVSVVPSDALPLVQSGRLDRRLFDITTLMRFGYDDRQDLPLIVTYSDTVPAASRIAEPGVRLAQALPTVLGQALRVSRGATWSFWRTLTGGADSPRTLTRGVDTVWLDGLRQPTLDESVPQIGAPTAWRAGYTGTGVTVAVLDTGIDASHPDLADRVVGEHNFTDDRDPRDLVGHGTHVASTIAGTGQASGGRYKGVAPGAKLLDGKVCTTAGCSESAILAGMDWAARRAKVVNMSLGGPDSPGVDPIERAVNTMTAKYGTLFVVAAGNDGPNASTVGSPGSADAALTVGAVDKSDRIAAFSSRGPRLDDSAIKPDITAPGVAITAARSKDGEFGNPGQSYVELSGTSMATPHVAGSAAILAQQHPAWAGARLKAALMGAAEGSPALGVFDQGAGRVDIGRAITQHVTASPANLNFGRQSWPHADDKPISKTVTYHNAGQASQTLAVAVRATGPDGKPVPGRAFTVSPPRLTVPAGRDASVTVTARTSIAGPDGLFGGYLTATGGAQEVRSPVAVDKEVEHHVLKVIVRDRTGHVPASGFLTIWNYGEGFSDIPLVGNGAFQTRLPKARYLLTSGTFGPDSPDPDAAQLVLPAVRLDRDRTVMLDSRKAAPVSVTVPQPRAKIAYLEAIFNMNVGSSALARGIALPNGAGHMFTGYLGTAPAPGMVSTVHSVWADPGADGRFFNSPFTYTLSWNAFGRFFTGFDRQVDERDLATVSTEYGQHATGSNGTTASFAFPVRAHGYFYMATTFLESALPLQRTEYFNNDNELWDRYFFEAPPDSGSTYSQQAESAAAFRPGKAYRQAWNKAAFGPVFAAGLGVSRSADTITANVPLYGDAAGHAGISDVGGGTTTLFRDGKEVAQSPEAGYGEFAVPAAPARYRLETVATRGAPFSLSTRISTVWTFRSGQARGDGPASLPVSLVRFTPRLDSANTAPAGESFTLPITVQRQRGLKAAANTTLTVEVSYDDGHTWQAAPLTKKADGKWTAQLRHPSTAGFVSLRAAAADQAGNTVEETIIRAYRIAIPAGPPAAR
jgi:subtilisin family serine protease